MKEEILLDDEEDMKQKPSKGHEETKQSMYRANLVDAKGSLHQVGLHHKPGASKGATSVSNEAASINEDAWALWAM